MMLAQAFAAFDVDGSGAISQAELQGVLARVGVEVRHAMSYVTIVMMSCRGCSRASASRCVVSCHDMWCQSR